PEPEPTPAKVVLSPATVELTAVGETVQLEAVVTDGSGDQIDDPDLAWSSLATEVAQVSSTGRVTAKSAGVALIVAMAGSVADTTRVTVEQVVTSVSVTPASPDLEVGDSVRLVAKAVDEG